MLQIEIQIANPADETRIVAGQPCTFDVEVCPVFELSRQLQTALFEFLHELRTRIRRVEIDCRFQPLVSAPNRLDHVQCRLKIFFGLTGESRNEAVGNADAGTRGALGRFEDLIGLVLFLDLIENLLRTGFSSDIDTETTRSAQSLEK